MSENFSRIELNTKQLIPNIAIGTWKSPKGDVGNAIKESIKTGYRHVDCASNYLNEMEIGDTLQEVFADKQTYGVSRSDLWITSKLNNPYHHKEHVKPHLLKTLKDLNLDYLDLYLLHWPVAFLHVPFDENRRGFDESYDPDGLSSQEMRKRVEENGGSVIDNTVSIRETWEAMQELVQEGLVRSIGVCNFTVGLLHDLLSYAKIKPVVNQVELHPYLQQADLVSFCISRKIQVEAYSPLGTPGFAAKDPIVVLQDPTLKKIAEAHKKSVAQICIRWAIQRNTIVLPKSATPTRIRENFDVFNFQLSEEEMNQIKGIDKRHRYLNPRDWYGVPLFE